MRPLDAAPSRSLHATTGSILDTIFSDAASGETAYVTQTLGRETTILRVDPWLMNIHPVAKISWPSSEGGEPTVEALEIRRTRKKVQAYRRIVPRVLVAPWSHTKHQFSTTDIYQHIIFDENQDVVGISRVSVKGRTLFNTRREREIRIQFNPEGTFYDDIDVLIASVLLASNEGEWKKAWSQSTLSLAQLQQAISVARLDFDRGPVDDEYGGDDASLGILW